MSFLYPPGCDKLDYEIELAVVIKEVLKNASPEEAARAISGYTLMSVTIRKGPTSWNMADSGPRERVMTALPQWAPRSFPLMNLGTEPAFPWN